ncbi:MAG: carbon-nitrogen hydrolase family protein [Planctomycetota bacterium]|jgi:predicted amidohydrolase
MNRVNLLLTCSLVASLAAAAPAADGLWFDEWRTFSPRKELSPHFEIRREGGPHGRGGLVIRHDDREYLDGAWMKTFEIAGDCHYRITAHSRTTNVSNARTGTYVELLFHDADGQLVHDEQIGVKSRPFYPPQAKPVHPGWTKFTGIYRAPAATTHVTIRLHLRWEPRGQVEWADVSLVKSGPRHARKVRLAAANYRPRNGKSARDNLIQLRPHVARAAELGADLVVLGECITSVGTGLSAADVAEPIPGESTDYLGRLAKEHRLYIATSINERYGHLIYNTAVLLSPEGKLVGKYRKVCLARDEYRGGTAPGQEFPVFDTEIGRIGMMICFDVHMPEVARGLAANGAEIIAMPIMGGHPALARARAIENQIYLVTSTYSINDDWMQSGVWDLGGEMLVRATEKDSVVVAEVDLSEQYFWRANMGEFKGRLRHERPAVRSPK